MKICSVEGCQSRSIARGYCSPHYGRWRHHGDPQSGTAYRSRPPADGICTIPGCTRKHYRRGMCTGHVKRMDQFGDPLAGPPLRKLRPMGLGFEEVFKHFMPGDPPKRGCWEWTGKVLPNGYGTITTGGKSTQAHRVSYAIFNGPIADGMMVRHTCDNRLCVKPSHLLLGTHADNMDDRDGRSRQAMGVQLPQHKLTPESVREIRSLATEGWSQNRLAQRYSVSRRAVQALLQGKTWKHVA